MKGAIIFDLDGTLTLPTLSFDAIRAELGLPPGPILESLAVMDEACRYHAEQVLDRHERIAAENAALQPGAVETLLELRRRGYPLAILTRNATQWANLVLRKFDITVDALRSRDHGVVKPSPEPVWSLCKTLSVQPELSWMVGDYLFDIQSGRDAGTATVLMLGAAELPDYAGLADHVIRSLPELLDIVPG